jgi:hypothetical protein
LLTADAIGHLNLSAAAEPDCDFAGFDDDRDLSTAVGMLQHALQAGAVFENIDVFERNLSAGEILTGSRSIGSKILTENKNLLSCRHLRLLFGVK